MEHTKETELTVKKLKQFLRQSELSENSPVGLHFFQNDACTIKPLIIGNNFDCQENLGYPKNEALIFYCYQLPTEKTQAEKQRDKLLNACKAMKKILSAIAESRSLTVKEWEIFSNAEQAIAEAEVK